MDVAPEVEPAATGGMPIEAFSDVARPETNALPRRESFARGSGGAPRTRTRQS